ncbi:MAG: NAD-dependent epimerase/dehydratase family protein [Pseudomonadota bacterium]
MIAITGATGFVGSHLLSRLDQLNEPTRALVRNKRNRTLHLPDSTQTIFGSLEDLGALSKFLDGARACIHVAGATTSLGANDFHAANVVGTYNMAAGAMAAGVEHFIYVSSQAAQAPRISDYAASKAIGEIALRPFDANMKITIIRPPAVIGPGDPMLQPMFDLIRLGWLPAPAEPKGRTREFAVISVYDLVSQIIACARAPENAEPLIEPCSVSSTNWSQIASVVSEVLERNVRVLRILPAVMKGAGYCADGLAALTRRPLPLSHQKVRELLAIDWTYDHPARDAMTLKQMFAACLVDQRP